ncbi:RidA family protein [Streptomyces spongiae]|uniref:RidA family protein n=1 Tax=Streptomyces spongiae TaxID=565072 RepID=A0A5N8X964_9ACTN|nr:RidA family protein [Streptomyces spongiae]MPY56050.1 RidA family protein [Streptomyces spongiae]
MPKSRRHPIEIPGLHHGGAPFPLAVRLDNLLVSSAVHGMDPDTGKVPDSLEAQTAGVFANIRRILDAAGAGTDDIAKVTVFLGEGQSREPLNAEWVAMFPDEQDRPVRHTVPSALQVPLLIQCEFTAVMPTRTPQEQP